MGEVHLVRSETQTAPELFCETREDIQRSTLRLDHGGKLKVEVEKHRSLQWHRTTCVRPRSMSTWSTRRKAGTLPINPSILKVVPISTLRAPSPSVAPKSEAEFHLQRVTGTSSAQGEAQNESAPEQLSGCVERTSIRRPLGRLCLQSPLLCHCYLDPNCDGIDVDAAILDHRAADPMEDRPNRHHELNRLSLLRPTLEADVQESLSAIGPKRGARLRPVFKKSIRNIAPGRLNASVTRGNTLPPGPASPIL